MIDLRLGDCLEIMKGMPDKSVDLVLTDPPYGIRIGKNGSVGGGSFRGKTQKFDNIDWDNSIPKKEYFDELFRVSKNQIIWGGNYFLDYLGSTRCLLVWYKRDGLPVRTFADCEIAWTSFNKNSQVFNCRWDGFIRDSKEIKVAHPTQKALEVMKWCVGEFSDDSNTILDPFMGSGTTGVACKELNRNFIGIEILPEYFKIAEQRINNTQGSLFNTIKPETINTKEER
jgi:DNA modification methylase